jgi:hAT family C-terminal dimerisation region
VQHQAGCCTAKVSAEKTFDLNAYIFKEQSLAKRAKEVNEKAAKKSDSKRTETVSMPSHVMLRVERVNVLLQDVNTKLYCLFVKNVLPVFDSANVFLQKSEPVIHLLHSVLVAQLRDLFVRFVKPTAILSCSKLHDVDFTSRCNQLDDSELFVGHDVTDYINNCTQEELALPQFYGSVRQFYAVACSYMVKRYPFDDELLMNAAVANIAERDKQVFRSVKYFADRFQWLFSNEQDQTTESRLLDELQSEFLTYQVDTLPDSVVSADRIDIAWHQLSNVKDVSTGRAKYPLLTTLMKAVLTMYHSNADCERFFSSVRKNKTDFRASMNTGTLSNILTHKTAMSAKSQVCHSAQHSDALLRKAKSSTYVALQAGQKPQQ